MATAEPAARERRAGTFLALAAVGCFITAPAFVLTADSAFSPLEIAFWRVAIGAVFVGALGLATRTAMRLRPGEWRRFVAYGLALALHLIGYVGSFTYTTIANAESITYSSTIMLAVLSAVVLRERLNAVAIAGLVVTVTGIAVLTGFQPQVGVCDIPARHCALLGDGLALVAAIFAAVYSLAGRVEREWHPLFRYTFYVYGFAALWQLPLAVTLAVRHTAPPGAVLALVGLGLVPTGVGHTLYNAAVRRVSATLVNLLSTQEITGGVILGALFFHQIPTALTLIGVLVTISGIILVMLNPPVARVAASG